jgi:hypothetical protein
MNNIKTLLSQVSDISKKYEEIAKLTGENYNVFRILKLTTAEVKAHSAFIGELLNPKGCHDQGAVFLELFFKMLEEKFEEKDFKPISGFDCENATAKVEKNIGVISENKEEGGRIDLIITDKMKNAIIIENKIYAADGEKQLLRYFNYGVKNHNKHFALLYLTLYGTEASNLSTGYVEAEAKPENETKINTEPDAVYTEEEEDKYNAKNISYHDDILAWLEKCKEKAVNHPMLRESIAQYINLIKYLTQQTINMKMEEEIKKLLKNDPSLIKPLWASYCALIKLNKEIADKLIEDLNRSLQKFKINLDKRNDIEIEPKLVNDNDGFHLCFYEVSRKFTQINEVFPEDVVNSLNNSFKTNGSPLCWKKLNVFGGQNLYKIPAEDFADLLQNTEKYKVDIISNVDDIIEEFETLTKV